MDNRNQGFIVTIDGPAASGKSTTARIVAQKMGWLYLDTGAMYRALAVKVLQERIALKDTKKISGLAERTTIELIPSDNGTQVFVDGNDVTRNIRSPEVDQAVGPVCEIPRVRKVLVSHQRKMAEDRNVVAEGRDMGTVVFPKANLKFFMKASLEERARRRRKDMHHRGIAISLSQIMEEIKRRDKRDENRDLSPLERAEDAILIDTTDMDVNEQVAFIIARIRQKKESERTLS